MPTQVGKPMGSPLIDKEEQGGYFRVNIGILNYGGFKYDSGEVVECKSDLTKHNTPGAPEKFSRIDKKEFDRVRGAEAAPEPKAEAKDNAPFSREDLDGMTFKELRDIASGVEGVQVLSTDKKSDLVEKIVAIG